MGGPIYKLEDLRSCKEELTSKVVFIGSLSSFLLSSFIFLTIFLNNLNSISIPSNIPPAADINLLRLRQSRKCFIFSNISIAINLKIPNTHYTFHAMSKWKNKTTPPFSRTEACLTRSIIFSISLNLQRIKNNHKKSFESKISNPSSLAKKNLKEFEKGDELVTELSKGEYF